MAATPVPRLPRHPLVHKVEWSDLPDDPASWSVKHVEQCVRIVALSMLTLCYRWLQQNDFASHMGVFREHKIDGPVLLSMNEGDLSTYLKISALGDIKRLSAKIELVKQGFHGNELIWWDEPLLDVICKFLFTAIYAFGVFALTAVVMTYVHDRIPDPVKYPPLPDILLDNLPIIPEAFQVAEAIILTMMGLFCIMLLLHKHRFVILRRFFALAGATFLLRCLTMYATSLSVPATHLKAWRILSGAGASITGVRTCGDYMFSGHTTLLTLLCYFLTEYTPATWEGLHMLVRFANYFGMLLVLIAHEHYTIDVTIAYAFSSRLFLYYHSLANQPRLAPNSRSFIPLFNYLEKHSVARVPNAYDIPFLAMWRWFSKTWRRNNPAPDATTPNLARRPSLEPVPPRRPSSELRSD